MLFNSRLCQVCSTASHAAFGSIQDRSSGSIAHHATQESLVDSVLRQSCHLCRFIVHHLRLHWAAEHREGLQELKEGPTSLTEEDFASSDFEFATFSSDRIIVRSYMLGLPERFNLYLRIDRFGDGSNGVFGLAEFACAIPDKKFAQSATSRFWIFDQRAFGGPPATSRFNGNTADADCQSMLKEWLSQCNTHQHCTIQRHSFLPTRLLDLNEVNAGNEVRLVLTKDLDKIDCYATLSHCWGGNVPFQLKKATMQKMMNGFELEELPKTFQDAIAVLRWSHVRYIWIDSCCIIQDSRDDWEQEAKLMQKVYTNTYLNISADHSDNSHGGCFTDRLAYKITPCTYDIPEIGLVYLLPQFDFTKPLTESTTATRAWITQERFLSPRTLHFTSDQMFWECSTLHACETFPKGVPHVYDDSTSRYYRAPPNLATGNQDGNESVYKAWGRICQDYSRSKLTFTSDKIIAFAGIAGEFQLRLPDDTYLAGLWKGDLIDGLLWKAFALDGWPIQANGSHDPDADPSITASKPEHYRAPSWSWLAKDVSIFWQTRTRYSPQPLVAILEANVGLINDAEPAGDIQRGHITVRGYLRAAQWSQEGQIDSIIFDGKSNDQILPTPKDPSSLQDESFTLQRDTGMQFPIKDILCFPLRLSLPAHLMSRRIPLMEGLILGPTAKENEYERLGHFEALGDAYCKALIFELCTPARGLEKPWEMLPKWFKEDASAGGQFQYDDEYFREVREKEFTIV